MTLPESPAAPSVFIRESGRGPAVVCLHSSASSSGQWKALMELLSDRYHVIAVDLYGSGKSPAWPGDRPMRLEDELALIEPALRMVGDDFHLVGHSFGGAIALKAALKSALSEPTGARSADGSSPRSGHPLSLILYEPVLFSVLVAAEPSGAATAEISAVRDDTTRWVEQGDTLAAAERFIDYWLGAGAWACTPITRRQSIAAGMVSVLPEWQAAFGEPTPLAAFGGLSLPTLLMTGERSTAAARAVTRLLAGVLPRASVATVDDVGHMAPVTHPQRINPLIEKFLVSTDR